MTQYISNLQNKVDPTRFSPLNIHYAVLEPLRYLFSFVPPENLRYHPDPKQTKIIIRSVNDKHDEDAIQSLPRILLNRGSYQVGKTGLSDNLAEGKSSSETGGLKKSKHSVFVRGMCAITIEASEEGVAELIADMVQHFIVWSKPHICNTFGFKEFGMPLSVSEPQMDTEDTEKFKIIISIPYLKEDSWKVDEDAVKIQGFLTQLVVDDC